MHQEEIDQHIVSAVLLRRWTANGMLMAFNVRLGKGRLRSPRAEGFVTGLLRHDAQTFEKKWKAIEDPMHDVFAAVDRGAALDDVATVDRLKDFFALHFSRSRTVIEVFGQSMKRSLLEFPRDPDLHDSSKLDELFTDLTGLHPAGPGARLYALEALLQSVEQQVGAGSAFFGQRLDANLDRIRTELDGWGLQIGVASKGEFIIGDDPVQTVDTETGRVGILSGVNLDVADTLLLPIGPRHVIAASKHNEWLRVPAGGVRRLNRVQLLTAHEKVYFRPNSATEYDVRATRDELLKA